MFKRYMLLVATILDSINFHHHRKFYWAVLNLRKYGSLQTDHVLTCSGIAENKLFLNVTEKILEKLKISGERRERSIKEFLSRLQRRKNTINHLARHTFPYSAKSARAL